MCTLYSKWDDNLAKNHLQEQIFIMDLIVGNARGQDTCNPFCRVKM